MTNITCDNCGTAFIPRQADARFCSRDCNIAWHAKERRAALAAYRAQGITYHDHAMADAETIAGGRFGAMRPQVNGADSIVRTPAAAPHWSRELASLPDEGPLGYDINQVEQE